MNIFTLSISYIKERTLANTLLVILLALGVATISMLLHFNHKVEEKLSRDARGFDLVIGAKGSPLQLILSSIYHMDIPTGNISVTEAEKFKQHPKVKKAIPLALGDNYRGFRIVGTEQSYITHYNAELAEGEMFTKSMQTVIGANVKVKAGMKLKTIFAGSHGISAGGDEHSDSQYEVVGILKPTGTIIDQLILTPVESVWEVHGGTEHNHKLHNHETHSEEHSHSEQKHEHEHNHKHSEHSEHSEHDEEEHKEDNEKHLDKHTKEVEASDEITALLISFNSPIAAMSLPREVNQMPYIQAASPSFETARLLSMLGIGLDVLKLFGMLLIISAVVGVLVAIYQSMQERRYDIAIMRVMGASKNTLVKQILLEAGLLLVFGIAFGMVISHTALAILPTLSTQLSNIGFTPFKFLAEEIYAVFGLLVAGLLVALIPALVAYRIDVSRTLTKA